MKSEFIHHLSSSEIEQLELELSEETKRKHFTQKMTNVGIFKSKCARKKSIYFWMKSIN